ncbi:hypothetical protein BASA50_010466 [Batrachochytrium salamandrivorans]|uniref:Uncharacterized protein n=1 Tax=Batrachochytrium salamandrivorans TaxID=1357716 RepID=A0ABQ8EYX9_9FUNG|nr:hypothetical protein BASA50_010466 [Batrachochytrium salamandrivorans]KAH9264946.1 hypothetical protein BASA83_011537 [Batrachochytrium salamandrivorans]
MQFFHLFSFVVVASYAAALPQPAELSDKYSNNVDATLASGLEARSYQPELNSYRESATLMSLKRRANSGSDSSPSSATTPEHTVNVPFTDNDVTYMNLASTINNVKNDGYILLGDEEKAGKSVDGPVGAMLTMYLGKATYIISAVNLWIENSLSNILKVIESGLGKDEYSRILPDLEEYFKNAGGNLISGMDEVVGYTTNIAEGVQHAAVYLTRIREEFQAAFVGCFGYIASLRVQLRKFSSGKILDGYLADIHKAIMDFISNDHEPMYFKLSRELDDAYYKD